MFKTLILYALLACPALLTCAFFAWCWLGFKEDRESHPIYRSPKPLSQTKFTAPAKQEKRCA